MKKYYNQSLKHDYVILFFLVVNMMVAQEKEVDIDPSSGIEPRITGDGVSFVDQLNPGRYANFTINYKINSNLFIELRGHQQINGIEPIETFKMPLMAKRYLNDKFYILSGLEFELTRNYFSGIESVPVQFKLINGVGYDVNSNFSVEVKQDFNFNSTNYGLFSNPNMLSVKGKLKF